MNISIHKILKEIEIDEKNKPWFKKFSSNIFWYMKDFIKNIKPSRILFNIHCFYQKKKYGFCDREIWNLDYTIAKFIYPRLKRFIKMKSFTYPSRITGESEEEKIKKWNEILNQILKSFHIILYEDKFNLSSFEYEKQKEKINKGLYLFSKYFQDLWD